MRLQETPWGLTLVIEAVVAAFVMGTVALAGWLKDEPVPLWAYFLAALLGIVMTNRPTIKEINRKLQ